MDELLTDFLTEANDIVEGLENLLVKFEQNPHDSTAPAAIFRLIHTLKGTVGFLGLDRLQTVSHHAETLIGLIRDGAMPTATSISLLLKAMDRLKWIVAQVEVAGAEPAGSDDDVIAPIDAYVRDGEPVASKVEPALVKAQAEPAENAPRKKQPKAKAGTVTPSHSALAQVAEPAAPRTATEVSPPSETPPFAKPANAATKNAETIRVPVMTLERIMELVSELVLTRNQLFELARQKEAQAFRSPLHRLSALTADLQDFVMRTRMQPMSRVFSTMPRIVRELAQDLGKTIQLETAGAETELDRQLIEAIRDPLTHLLRNCADHGIETPDARRAAGKPEAGTIRVSASHVAGQVVIEISDDGRGLNAQRIRDKALANGLATEAELREMPDAQVYRFILEPGFSTASAVTTVSGRGVGMDVVRSNIEAIGGTVSLFSEAGRGSRFVLKIPLTLAIEPALIVSAGGERFALPQDAVVEAVGVGPDFERRVECLQGALILNLRGRLLPVLDLSGTLGLDGEPRDSRLVVVIRTAGRSYGIIVDDVADIQEIVVKPIDAALNASGTFSGHSILGDGSVVLILDPEGLASRLGQKASIDTSGETAHVTRLTDANHILVFEAGAGLPKTLPLSLVSRIVSLKADEIVQTGSGTAFLLHETLTPLLDITQPAYRPGSTVQALLLSIEDQTFGLIIDEVLDVSVRDADVQLSSASPLVSGTARVGNRTVDVLDAGELFRRAFPDAFSTTRKSGRAAAVVDPDPKGRDVVAAALKSAGFHAVAAPSVDAVKRMEAAGEAFSVVLVDETVWDRAAADGLGQNRALALLTGRLEDAYGSGSDGLDRLSKYNRASIVRFATDNAETAPAKMDHAA
jgi:two-component system chemotaxis sensor kinase CheA